MLTLNLALAGLSIGAIAALSGLGLLVTYRTTGVLDLAHGAFAMMTAYLLWQAVRGWGWPLEIAAPLAIFVVGPGLGLLADLLVFRPLRHRGAGPSESLVASLGVLVLLMGVAFQVWGGQAHLDAPSIFPSGAIRLPGGATVLTQHGGDTRRARGDRSRRLAADPVHPHRPLHPGGRRPAGAGRTGGGERRRRRRRSAGASEVAWPGSPECCWHRASS